MPVAASNGRAQSDQAALLQKARHIHARVLVLDSHIDFEPADLTGARNYTQRLETQFNLPNMIDGGLDALFFVIYVGQTRESQNPDALKAAGYQRAYKAAVEKFEAVNRFTSEIARDQIELAFSADEIRRIHEEGKKAALMGVENGYPLGEELDRVKEFYHRGARYLSLTHNGHNQLADSHTGERDGWKWQGVSPLGKQIIAELNRVGIMVDVSHASKESMMQIAALSKAPIIASHSAARALCDVSSCSRSKKLAASSKSSPTTASSRTPNRTRLNAKQRWPLQDGTSTFTSRQARGNERDFNSR
jgi:membrane dipeptidase